MKSGGLNGSTLLWPCLCMVNRVRPSPVVSPMVSVTWSLIGKASCWCQWWCCIRVDWGPPQFGSDLIILFHARLLVAECWIGSSAWKARRKPFAHWVFNFISHENCYHISLACVWTQKSLQWQLLTKGVTKIKDTAFKWVAILKPKGFPPFGKVVEEDENNSLSIEEGVQ